MHMGTAYEGQLDGRTNGNGYGYGGRLGTALGADELALAASGAMVA